MRKLLSSIFLSLTLLVTPALAVTTVTPTIPPHVQEVCPNGTSTYEDGLTSFTSKANELGGSFLSLVKFDDGSFVSIWDFRNAPDVDQSTPFFVLVFGSNHCFATSVWFSQQQVQDTFGIVLAIN